MNGYRSDKNLFSNVGEMLENQRNCLKQPYYGVGEYLSKIDNLKSKLIGNDLGYLYGTTGRDNLYFRSDDLNLSSLSNKIKTIESKDIKYGMHNNILQNIDSTSIDKVNKVFNLLNNVNEGNNVYTSKHSEVSFISYETNQSGYGVKKVEKTRKLTMDEMMGINGENLMPIEILNYMTEKQKFFVDNNLLGDDFNNLSSEEQLKQVVNILYTGQMGQIQEIVSTWHRENGWWLKGVDFVLSTTLFVAGWVIPGAQIFLISAAAYTLTKATYSSFTGKDIVSGKSLSPKEIGALYVDAILSFVPMAKVVSTNKFVVNGLNTSKKYLNMGKNSKVIGSLDDLRIGIKNTSTYNEFLKFYNQTDDFLKASFPNANRIVSNIKKVSFTQKIELGYSFLLGPTSTIKYVSSGIATNLLTDFFINANGAKIFSKIDNFSVNSLLDLKIISKIDNKYINKLIANVDDVKLKSKIKGKLFEAVDVDENGKKNEKLNKETLSIDIKAYNEGYLVNTFNPKTQSKTSNFVSKTVRDIELSNENKEDIDYVKNYAKDSIEFNNLSTKEKINVLMENLKKGEQNGII